MTREDADSDVATAVTTRDEQALWARWRGQRVIAAREELIERYRWLPRKIAAQALRDGGYASDLDRRDLVQAATLAMIQAMDRFDPGTDRSFVAFASKRLRGAILDEIDGSSDLRSQIALARDLKRERIDSLSGSAEVANRLKRVVEIAVGVAVGILLEDSAMFVDDTTPSVPYTSGELQILRLNLLALIERLPTQERSVLNYHYFHDLSFAHIADLLGVTRARVSQIHAKALAEVRTRYADLGRYDELA